VYITPQRRAEVNEQLFLRAAAVSRDRFPQPLSYLLVKVFRTRSTKEVKKRNKARKKEISFLCALGGSELRVFVIFA
jgi:hypothetical protein